MCLNAEDAGEVCQKYMALDRKVLMTGHVERFNPVVQKLEKILAGEDIIAVTMERCSPMDMHISDTDVIYDLMIHDIDILLNVIFPGLQLNKVHAFGRTSYNTKNVDFVQAIFKFENEAQASIISSRTTDDRIRKINVHCKKSYIECDLLHNTLTISGKKYLSLTRFHWRQNCHALRTLLRQGRHYKTAPRPLKGIWKCWIKSVT